MLNQKFKHKIKLTLPKLNVQTFEHHVSTLRLVIFIIVFAGIGGYIIFKSLAAEPVVAIVEAEHMTLSDGGIIVKDNHASGGEAAKLSRPGSLQASVNLPSASTGFSVRARVGNVCSNSVAHMSVVIDGTVAVAQDVTKNGWTYFSNSNFSLHTGNHWLKINMKTSASCSRHLFVDVITFYGPVVPPPPPTVALSASATTVKAGAATTLTWTSTNASSCTASGAWNGTEPLSGSANTGALNSSASYGLTCTGDGGNAASQVVVNVVANVPKHVETWAYDDSTTSTDCNGGWGASQAVVQQWLSYAETNCGPADPVALNNCHAGGVVYCKVMAYIDSTRIYPTSVPVEAASQENWWLHQPGFTDFAHRLKIPFFGGGYILNNSVPAVDAWYASWAKAHYDSYDGLFMDDSGARVTGITYGSGYTSSQELTTDAQVVASRADMAAGLNHTNGTPFLKVDNTLDTWPVFAQPFNLLNSSSSVNGLMSEGSPFENGTIGANPNNYPDYVIRNKYATLLDDMGNVASTSNGFLVLLSYDKSGAGGSGNQMMSRRVQASTVLLGYSPGRVVSWSNLETDSLNLSVWPEQGIYPMSPVQTMAKPSGAGCLTGGLGYGTVCSAGGHNDIQVANGVYRREFKDCYNQGVRFGSCAVMVNDTANAVTIQSSWLTQSYAHQITFVGGDVQSGGTINLTGSSFSPGSTSVAANDATMLAP